MAIDREFLRQHYASLSDEALAAVDRNDLVEAAQMLYDEERARRGLAVRQKAAAARPAPVASSPPADREEAPDDAEDLVDGAAPAWIDSAACACEFPDYPEGRTADEVAAARDVLETAGIPSYVTMEEAAPQSRPRIQRAYRILIPAGLNLKAQAILEKEIYNEREEMGWRAQLEELSDEALAELTPDVICAGLVDRIERLTRIYNEEVAHRESEADSQAPG